MTDLSKQNLLHVARGVVPLVALAVIACTVLLSIGDFDFNIDPLNTVDRQHLALRIAELQQRAKAAESRVSHLTDALQKTAPTAAPLSDSSSHSVLIVEGEPEAVPLVAAGGSPDEEKQAVIDLGDAEDIDHALQVWPRCKVEFDRYEMSDLEAQWVRNARDWGHDPCSRYNWTAMELWDQGATRARENHKLLNDPHAFPKDVFSRFYHTVSCPNREPFSILTWIEPLAGLTRHPFAVCRNNDYLMNSDAFMADNGIVPYLGSRTRYVFDLGATVWDPNPRAAGQHWLWANYWADKVKVERFLAWEVKQFSPQEVFNNLPFDMRIRLSYYPVPCDPNNRNANPMEYIRALKQPGDHMVLKLDIDTPDVEDKFLHDVIDHPEIVHEMYMEQHVNVGPMLNWWGSNVAGTLETTYNDFGTLRKHGVRMHSWP